MGNDDLTRTFTRLNEGVRLLNQEINKMDWGKRWQEHYPKTERAKEETEGLKTSTAQKVLKELFSDDSLILKNLGEVF